MGLEIEHKFLVTSQAYRSLAEPVRYRQGYLCNASGKTIRIRIAGTKGYIAVKSGISGSVRREFEYEIPLSDAEEMLNGLSEGNIVEKYRYRIPYQGFVWEVDEFTGDNAGLVVAEVELAYRGQTFAIPSWVGTEVTGKVEYLNSSLSKKPYNTW